MHRFIANTANVATWALAVMPMIALAGAAHAQDIKVQVGDLSQPAAAARFERHLDVAAKAICASYVRPIDGATRAAACKQAVRAEAMDKLSAAQREQLAAAIPAISVASAR
jgi:UrcA family protein